MRKRVGRLLFLVGGAICVIGLLSAAKGTDFDDFIEALNELVEQQGPVPGHIAKELPQSQAIGEVAAAGEDLSDGQTNTPDPVRATSFAFETSELNSEESIVYSEMNLSNLQRNGTIDVPTGAFASPLFGAREFSQQMLRFEEFGMTRLGPESSPVAGHPFPTPPDSENGPSGPQLDAFLRHYISPAIGLLDPYPTRTSNDPDNGGTDENPWKSQIEAFLGRSLVTPPAEGRPPGEEWAHQRWNEFYPQAFVLTAQAGARMNSGLRDQKQSHRYSIGEFAPGGLYHNTAGAPGFDGTSAGIELRYHPDFPVQHANAVWTFDGTLPPKLLTARYGEPFVTRHYNALPIDPATNYGFGLHTISTHPHNVHVPAESDGYTQAFFFPGQFYDYRWPMVLAGYDTINTDASNPRAGMPDGNGGITNVRGDWRETMSSLWFHDHMLDFTATNVYKGNAAALNYYSSTDRGREPATAAEANGHSGYACHYANPDNVNLCLPSGSGLDWGNRDYDINLMIADKAWDAEGQLFFNIFNMDGFIGDQILTNWRWKPTLDVAARRYRLRLLNASVSRYFRIALVEKIDGTGGELRGPPGSGTSYNRVPMYMIANDGNIMEHAVYFDGNKTVGGLVNRNGILPTQSIAERYDIVVDFSDFSPGTKLYLVNVLEHHDGRRPYQEIPLADVLGGKYKPKVRNGRNRTDPAVSKFLEFKVHAYGDVDRSMDPADYVEGRKKMIPLPTFSEEELAGAIHRTFEFKRSSGTDHQPWTVKSDGSSAMAMDPQRLSAAASLGNTEIWHLEGGFGWAHPIHIHFEEGQILKKDGKAPPEWEQWARKDVYRLGRAFDSARTIDVAIRFREFLGSFMEHCHNTQHEDHAMLLRWDVENPGQVRVMPTPMPTWDGVGYVPSYALPTFRTGVPEAMDNFHEAGGTSPRPNTAPFDTVVATGVADKRGRIRLLGRVEPGQPFETFVDGVPGFNWFDAYCRVRASGTIRCRARDLEPGQRVTIRSQGNVSAPAQPISAAMVVGEGTVTERGRLRIRGWVQAGSEAVADLAGVSCSTSSYGRLSCRGRDLAPGQSVTVRITSSAVVAEEPGGGHVAREQADHRGRIRIRGRVEAGEEVRADIARVSCRTSSLGHFYCKASGLDPNQWITIRKVLNRETANSLAEKR